MADKWPSAGILEAIALCPLLLISGCADGSKTGGFEMPPIPVEAATAVRRTITDEFTAVGSLDAINAIEVVAEIDGKILALPFKEGSYIAEGGLIAQLDDSQLRAERDRAQAVLDQRRVTFDRIKELVAQNLSPRQDLDDASAAYKVAEADLALSEARLAKTSVQAPFAGQIGARQVSIGEFLRTGQPITDLAQLEQLKVVFSAPERFLSRLHKGSSVTVASPAFPDVTIEGEIDVIEPVVSTSTRSVNIVARLPNRDRLFRPGMSADVSVVLSRREGALVIPSEAVFAEGNQMFVFTIGAEGNVAKTPVELGSRSAQDVEVLTGLSESQQIVRAGHQKLFEGARVMVASAPGTAPAAGGPSTGGAHDGPARAADSTATGL
jgi:membrane fusion protein (multidrug efflux system)